MLVPPREDPVQRIDVRDVAEWSVQVAERQLTGAYNLKGPAATTMGEMLDTIRAVANPAAVLREASRDFLQANGVQAWADLPVWIPASATPPARIGAATPGHAAGLNFNRWRRRSPTRLNGGAICRSHGRMRSRQENLVVASGERELLTVLVDQRSLTTGRACCSLCAKQVQLFGESTVRVGPSTVFPESRLAKPFRRPEPILNNRFNQKLPAGRSAPMLEKLNELTEGHGALKPGHGLITGVIALSLAILCFLGVLAFRFPEYLTTPQLRKSYDVDTIRKIMLVALVIAGGLSLVNIIFNRARWLSALPSCWWRCRRCSVVAKVDVNPNSRITRPTSGSTGSSSICLARR